MKYHSFLLLLACALVAGCAKEPSAQIKFAGVRRKDIVDSKGNPIVLKGINLGNWLHPEGYMFRFEKTNSAEQIDRAFAQAIGPDRSRAFWNKFLSGYVTAEDIRFLKEIGANHIRLPVNYRMLTDEDYLGENNHGFQYLDSAVRWCQREGLYVLLDMHAAPGGQTGDNIDDSYGYPFLFADEPSKQQTIDLWRSIAEHYKNDTTVIGYDLLNEPIATYFESDFNKLNPELEPLYKRIVSAIREVDKNHLVFLGGAQWNNNFAVFGPPFDDKAVYTFHKYWFDVNASHIQEYLDFQKKYNVPLYLGESGENTDEWVRDFRMLLDEHNISWCFWPYKKLESTSGIMTIGKPDQYDSLIQFVESDRSTFAAIRKRTLSHEQAERILDAFNTQSDFSRCTPNKGYIEALGFSLPK